MSGARQRHLSKAASDIKGDVTMEPSQGTGEVTTEPSIGAKPGASEIVCPDTEQSHRAKSSSSETLCPSTAESRSERSSSILTSSSSSDKSRGSLGDISNSSWRDFISAWVARQAEETRSYHDTYVKPTRTEKTVYAVFMLLVIIIVASLNSVPMYNYSQTVGDLFLGPNADSGYSFKDIHTVDDFWEYVRGPLMVGLYPEVHCNNPEWQGVKCNFHKNKLVGVPRIRQLRVRSDSCQVHSQFASLIPKCFAEYSKSDEDQKPFNMYLMEPNNTAWHYYSESELNGQPHTGLVSTYSGGGYYVDLKATREESEVIIENLVAHDWIIQRETRAVFIDFTMYNKYIHLLCVVRLVVEFPGTGSAFMSWSFRTLRMTRFCTTFDYFLLTCEILYGCIIVIYIAEEMLKIKKLKWSYFKGVWNILDLIVILISLTWAGFTVYRSREVTQKLAELEQNPDVFTDFDMLSYWDAMLGNAIVAVAFVAGTKIFKYVGFHETVTNLLFTLERSARSLSLCLLQVTIGVVAFTSLGYLMFGPYVQDFSSFAYALSTLGRMFIGDYTLTELNKANCIFGLPFFVGFVAFFLVTFAKVITIIKDAYPNVPLDMADRSGSQTTDYRQRNSEVLSRLNLQRKTTADLNLNPMTHFEDWRKQLKTAGYKEYEIEMIFATYEITFGGDSDEESTEPDESLFRNVGEGVGVRRPSGSGDDATNDGDSCAMQSATTGTRSSDTRGPRSSNTSGPRASNTRRRSRYVERDEFSGTMWNMGSAFRSLPIAVAKSRLIQRKMTVMEDARRRRWAEFEEVLKIASEDIAINIGIFQLIVDFLARLRSVVCHCFLSDRLTYPVSGNFSERTRREYMESLIREELEELEEYDFEIQMPEDAPRAEPGPAGNDHDGRVSPKLG